MKIIIMGLPGSGKSTLAKELSEHRLNDSEWLNADVIRQQYNDWDFSVDGRLRQAHRMKHLANCSSATFVIADLVAPLPEMRDIYAADFTVWVDTINFGRYSDTNQMFVPPILYDIRITEKDSSKWATIIATAIHEKLSLAKTLS